MSNICMNQDVDINDLLKIKSEIICYGIRRNKISDKIYDMEHKSKEKNRIDYIIKALKIILTKDNTIKSINLTGGNLYTSDKGASQYIHILKEIRRISDIPVAVEIWDDKIRKMMMPGKGQIKREYYIKAWKKAVEIFGKGNVGSAIIIGLESLESSLKGIKAMIEVDCLPSIIPFKSSTGAVLENFRKCSSKDVYTATKYAAKLLIEKELSPINRPGCIGCGACTLESDFFKI